MLRKDDLKFATELWPKSTFNMASIRHLKFEKKNNFRPADCYWI